MSSHLELLDVDQAQERALDWPDVYFSPLYGRACEISEKAAWEVAVWKGGLILLPYLKRQVPSDIGGSRGHYDIVSPYGYAGAWSRDNVPVAEWESFRGAFRRLHAERGGVAEFLRLSALVSGRELLRKADPLLSVAEHHDTIAIDLTRGAERCFAAYEGRARTKVRKAQKLGYSTRIRMAAPGDFSPDAPFPILYRGTMERVDASDYYFFDGEYFASLASALGNRMYLVEVRDSAGATVSSGIGFLWLPFIHLHLVGSQREALRDGVGNLLYDAVIKHGCELGASLLHVGGGLTAGDALFYFKKGFGGHPVSFWLGRSILDPPTYARLVAARATSLGQPQEALHNFFPAYRSAGRH